MGEGGSLKVLQELGEVVRERRVGRGGLRDLEAKKEVVIQDVKKRTRRTSTAAVLRLR